METSIREIYKAFKFFSEAMPSTTLQRSHQDKKTEEIIKTFIGKQISINFFVKDINECHTIGWLSIKSSKNFYYHFKNKVFNTLMHMKFFLSNESINKELLLTINSGACIIVKGIITGLMVERGFHITHKIPYTKEPIDNGSNHYPEIHLSIKIDLIEKILPFNYSDSDIEGS